MSHLKNWQSTAVSEKNNGSNIINTCPSARLLTRMTSDTATPRSHRPPHQPRPFNHAYISVRLACCSQSVGAWYSCAPTTFFKRIALLNKFRSVSSIFQKSCLSFVIDQMHRFYKKIQTFCFSSKCKCLAAKRNTTAEEG